MEQHLLKVQELHTSFFTHMGEVQAVRGVSFYVDQGEVIGVIGESGCGKSVTALSIMGLLSKQGRVTDGEVRFKGENLLSLSKKDRAGMRGKHIAMIFQDSMTSLDPVFTVGDQMSEVLRYHTGIGKEEALARCIEMLGLVGMDLLQKVMSYYMGEFGVVFIAVTLALFSFSTFLGILFYARSNVAYLFGNRWIYQTLYKIFALIMLFVGGLQAYTVVWDLGDVGVGLMTVFNLIVLFPLSGEALRALKEYEEKKTNK